MGQAGEIQGLLDMMKGMEKVANLMNEILLAKLSGKPQKSVGYRKLVIDESFSLIINGLEKFVTGKTERISKLINYLGILHQDIKNEKDQLRRFEQEWEPISRELDIIRVELLNKPAPSNIDEAMKQIGDLKNNFLPKALPIAQNLADLENRMQKRHIQALALLTTLNTSLDTNQLYRLLTDDP
ncbi:MAG: hypothetical protein QXI71_04375 [Candidatus Bathyarchaeia archaeon]